MELFKTELIFANRENFLFFKTCKPRLVELRLKPLSFIYIDDSTCNSINVCNSRLDQGVKVKTLILDYYYDCSTWSTDCFNSIKEGKKIIQTIRIITFLTCLWIHLTLYRPLSYCQRWPRNNFTVKILARIRNEWLLNM